MKQLLTDIRTRLRSQVSAVADESIYILPDKDLVPRSAQLPAIGLKDGDESYEQNLGQRRQLRTLNIEISVYVSIPRADTPEAPIMGSGTIKGVLDIAEDIHTALNRWDIGGNYFARRPVSAEGSVPMATTDEGPEGGNVRLWAQRKTLLYEFRRTEIVSPVP